MVGRDRLSSISHVRACWVGLLVSRGSLLAWLRCPPGMLHRSTPKACFEQRSAFGDHTRYDRNLDVAYIGRQKLMQSFWRPQIQPMKASMAA